MDSSENCQAIFFRYEVRKNAGEVSNRFKKLNEISKGTFDIFMEKKREHMPVHDRDLRRWALKCNNNLLSPLRRFKASKAWLHVFKRKHRIVTRKITKFVSIGHIRESENLKEAAEKFVKDMQPLITKFSPERTFNTDQSGFQKELHSGRTLSIRGEKNVETVVQSVNATTHSYTIQPTISASGKLLSPLFICLQEPKGEFPKKKKIFKVDFY